MKKIRYNVICRRFENFKFSEIITFYYERSIKYYGKPYKNPNVNAWVDEMIALTKPDNVVWIDGSDEQLQSLREEALSTGEMTFDESG